ncbi:MAG: EAL domain-containing protein [Desulforhopalus sp.]
MLPAKTVENLRFRYITGLSIIALLITSSSVMMQKVTSDQLNYSSIISLAGHQAGLVNRIAYFSSLMAISDNDTEFAMAQAQVGRTINKLKKAHQALRHGSQDLNFPKVTNENLEIIYEDPAVGLEVALHRFLERAEAVHKSTSAELNIHSIDYVYLTTYGPHALEPMMDAAVDEYKKITRNAIARLERLEWFIWLATIFTLLSEILFIFRPFEGRMRQTLNSLERSITTLTSTRKRLLDAQRMASVGDWQLEIETGELTWSDQVYLICGVSPNDFSVSRQSSNQLIHPDDRNAVKVALLRALKNNETISMEYRFIRPDGSERLVFQQTVPVTNPTGKVHLLQGTIQDITERKELSLRLEKQAENIPGFIFQFHLSAEGAGRFVYASKGVNDIYGVSPEDIMHDSSGIAGRIHSGDNFRVRKRILVSSIKLTTWRDQFRVYHPEKGEIWVEGHATPEKLTNGGTQWYGYLWDVTERKVQENQIRQLALYDPLTGLANRRLLKDRMRHAMITAQRQNDQGALLMIDLDNFKILNDTRGHSIGDELLIEVSKRLQRCVRETDTIARLGGDEFVVLLELLETSETEALQVAMMIAEKILLSLATPYPLGVQKRVHHASASIGVAMFKGRQLSDGELLKRADVAMFEAKELGRNCVCLYNKKRQVLISSKTAIAGDLRRALANDELSLHYQPQVNSVGKVCGAEALLRWFPPGKDPISPGVFIPIAEETGLIITIGEWVLNTACQNILELSKKKLPDNFAIAVNISARQFSDADFLAKIRATIGRYNIDTKHLKLELTESSLVKDLGRAQHMLEALRAMGLHIELDDFGTGYSSLTSLKNLPLNTLKVDKSLVHGIGVDIRDEAILMAAVAMAKALKLNVIAEGVETKLQNDFLIEKGCDLLQGFLHARPMSFDKFIDFLGQNNDLYERHLTKFKTVKKFKSINNTSYLLSDKEETTQSLPVKCVNISSKICQN